MINFDYIEEKEMPNFLGGDGIIYIRLFEDEYSKIMRIRIPYLSSIGFHIHEETCEIVYILSGKATFNILNKEEVVTPGLVHYCPKKCGHSVINKEKEDLLMYCVVSKTK